MTGLRVLSALILAAALLAIIVFAPPSWTATVCVLTLLVCAWEWSGFLRSGSVLLRVIYVVSIAVLMGLAWVLSATQAGLAAVLGVAALWWVAVLCWLVAAPHQVQSAQAWLAGWLTLVPAGIALLRMRLDWEPGRDWLLYVLFLVWAADTGAYFAGRRFGRHKLAPQVSPGKSWEGVAGGLVLVCVLAVSVAAHFGQPPFSFALLSLLVAAFSVVGDLNESMFKRFAGLKDSGRLIPGHGGLMDRMDSITAAAPLLMLGVHLLGGTRS